MPLRRGFIKTVKELWALVFVLHSLLPATALWATEGVPASQPPEENTGHEKTAPSRAPESPHRFWDSTNVALVLGVGGARALDFGSSQSFRSKGSNEILLSNSIVDNKPLFASIEVAGTAASVAVAYLFHRSGHHRVERWVSIIHISVGVGGSIHNFLLQPSPSVSPTP